MFDFALTVMGYVGIAILAVALLAIIVAAVMRWRREEQDREQAKLEAAFQRSRKTWPSES